MKHVHRICSEDDLLRRFFVEEIKPVDGSCIIRGSEARHISRVLRMGRGDRLILMDKTGARFQAIIKSTGNREVVVALEKSLPKPSASPVEIVLCQALLKSQPMDYVIQKTSELGVAHIVPFSSARTVVRLPEDRFFDKLGHWRHVSWSAAKQADRDVPARLGPYYAFPDLMARWKDQEALKVILWEKEGAKDLKTLLAGSSPTGKVVIVVGPEGGFPSEEMDVAREAGFKSISLGRRVLRAETAAVTVVAIVQYEWGDLSLKNLEI
jgi:16S rRNA (uracil1498-N3)-methyltransferase